MRQQIRNTFAFIAVAMISFSAYAQDQEMIKVSGKMYAMNDSTPVQARLLYQKLPYYDDMGVMNSSADGSYEIFLVKGNSYDINVTANGFEKFTDRLDVDKGIAGAEMSKDFYLVISDELRLIKLENLIFDAGRSTITPESFQELNDLADWLNARPDKIIQLEGHTDFQGNADANMRLSQDRVDAVKEYLVDRGVKKNSVQTKAFGGTQPLFRERTDEAKELNRRVEVRVIN